MVRTMKPGEFAAMEQKLAIPLPVAPKEVEDVQKNLLNFTMRELIDLLDYWDFVPNFNGKKGFIHDLRVRTQQVKHGAPIGEEPEEQMNTALFKGKVKEIKPVNEIQDLKDQVAKLTSILLDKEVVKNEDSNNPKENSKVSTAPSIKTEQGKPTDKKPNPSTIQSKS